VREVSEQLGREGFPAAETKAAVLALRRLGALDDTATASRYARSRLQHVGLGTRRIRAALVARGVKDGAIARGMGEALEEVPEEAAMEALVRRRWPQQKGGSEAERLQRLAAFLLRRGFPTGLVAERLRRLAPRSAEALDAMDDMAFEEES
jgi:regulatory protein